MDYYLLGKLPAVELPIDAKLATADDTATTLENAPVVEEEHHD
jgi:hypothetical protein